MSVYHKTGSYAGDFTPPSMPDFEYTGSERTMPSGWVDALNALVDAAILGGDRVATAQSYLNNTNAGTATVTYALSGSDGGNYSLSTGSQNFLISKKQVAVTVADDPDRIFTYGSTADEIWQSVFRYDASAFVPGDTVGIGFGGLTAGRVNASASPYTATASLSGSDAGNYKLADAGGLNFNVEPIPCRVRRDHPLNGHICWSHFGFP